MSRGVGYGGGRSSLGYLFGGSGEQDPPGKNAPPPLPLKLVPPYGTNIEDGEDEKQLEAVVSTLADKNQDADDNKNNNHNNSNNCGRDQGQNSGNIITDRPTTKVKSVPGGNSSLGYLFGDK